MKKENKKSNLEEPLENYSQPLNFQQVWQMFQETDRQFKETDKKIKALSDLFTSQWGKLIESLVEGDLIRLLNERGIPVNETAERKKGRYNGKNFEFDIVAENGEEVVFVEVKTTLRPADVKDFTEKLKMVKTWMPKYRCNMVVGAMAFLKAHAGSEAMAENQGLFAIRATGNSASIINAEDFEPRRF